MTVKLGHDIWDMTSATPLNRTAKTGQSDQVSLTDQPGQDKEEGMPEHNSKDRTVVTSEVGTGELGTRAMD
jgi:hypothetical protein